MDYTHGEWQTKLLANGHYSVFCNKGLIGDVYNNIEHHEGNAALISASPEMYQILKAIQAYEKDGLDRWDWIQTSVNKALKKIEGK